MFLRVESAEADERRRLLLAHSGGGGGGWLASLLQVRALWVDLVCRLDAAALRRSLDLLAGLRRSSQCDRRWSHLGRF